MEPRIVASRDGALISREILLGATCLFTIFQHGSSKKHSELRRMTYKGDILPKYTESNDKCCSCLKLPITEGVGYFSVYK